MKKIALLAALTFLSASALAECTITSVRDDKVTSVFRQHGGWTMDAQAFEALCQKLQQHRARIRVQAMASVLGNKSIGWAALSLSDLDTGISTQAFSQLHLMQDDYASQDKAELLMAQSINNAALNWSQIDKALASLDAERANARMVLAARKVSGKKS